MYKRCRALLLESEMSVKFCGVLLASISKFGASKNAILCDLIKSFDFAPELENAQNEIHQILTLVNQCEPDDNLMENLNLFILYNLEDIDLEENYFIIHNLREKFIEPILIELCYLSHTRRNVLPFLKAVLVKLSKRVGLTDSKIAGYIFYFIHF